MSAFLAGVLAGSLVVQPVLAWPSGPSPPPPSSAPVVAQSTDADCVVERVPLTAQQTIVAQRLVELGRSADEAAALASALTDDDLEVLVNNPKMIQTAGASNAYTWGIIGVVVLIGGLIALAIASDSGSVSVF